MEQGKANASLSDSLEFDEESHVYTLDGKQIISVTQLLERQKISPSYSAVNIEKLMASAEKGKQVHKEIEEYNKFGTIGFTAEMQSYADYLTENELHCVESEFQVHTDYYAGTLDEILCTKEGELIIADNKTTAQLHRESISWQISLYAYAYWVMTGTEISHGQVFWFKKDGSLSVLDIPLKPREEVEALVTADKSGQTYKSPYPIEVSEIAYMENLKARQAELEAEIKQIKAEMSEYSAKAIKAMKEKSILTFDTGFAKFTVVSYAPAKKFDEKKFKSERPDDWSDYLIDDKKKDDVLKITIAK